MQGRIYELFDGGGGGGGVWLVILQGGFSVLGKFLRGGGVGIFIY